MIEATWLARTRDADEVTCWRTHTDGDAPSPTQAWEPIPDCVALARARRAPLDLATLVAEAAPLGPARSLMDQRLIPACEPQKVIGIGRNYKAHAEELGNEVPESPLCFMKAPSCLQVSGDPLVLPRGFERIDMEAELVVVIGRRARGVAAEHAWQHVGGYLLGNDVSCRDLQARDKQWTRAKGLDGFGPISSCLRLTPPGWALPAAQLEILGYLDDELVQQGRVDMMIFSIPALIEHLSEFMTLEVGDMIFTGTPAGVRALSPGSRVRVVLRESGSELGSEPGFQLAALVTNVV